MESVVTCQVTPGGKLANQVRKAIGTTKEGKKRLVQEEGGRPVTLGLKQANPFKKPGCAFDDEQCMVRDGEDCGTMMALYCIICKGCKQELGPYIRENPSQPGGIHSSHYIGMTASSAHSRWRKHKEDHVRKSSGSALHHHDVTEHNGEIQKYYGRIITKEISLLTLGVKEAVLQGHQKPGVSMNDRIEMGRRGGLIRIAAQSG